MADSKYRYKLLSIYVADDSFREDIINLSKLMDISISSLILQAAAIGLPSILDKYADKIKESLDTLNKYEVI